MSGFTDRENEDPEELPMFEHRQHGHAGGNLAHFCNRCLDQSRQPRSAARALSRLRPGPLAGDRLQVRLDERHATDHSTASLPVIEHPDTLTKPRHARSAAGTLSRRRPGPLAGDRHQVLLDAGAVVASWPASPIERTKTREHCR
jgi:hypothetical protein